MATSSAQQKKYSSSPVRLRSYQAEATERVANFWEEDACSVCLVAPTGSGKTTMGSAIASKFRSVLWIAHRRELIAQAAVALQNYGAVGIVAPDETPRPEAQFQVATVQTLLNRGKWPAAELLVIDEQHHFLSDQWRLILSLSGCEKVLGLTATPERSDGRPIGDICDALVQAATYSQLLADGYLVPCRIFQPSERLVGALAQAPLAAYQRYSPGERAFVFSGSIDEAERTASEFTAAGIPARAITSYTPKEERDAFLAAFRAGALRVLTNVNTLTEGVDVPEATTAILARSCEHAGTYLQIAGRILRPAPGKTEATLIDLTGASLKHGFPTDDRTYSLEGKAISRQAVPALSTCLSCGAVYRSGPLQCPMCGVVQPRQSQEKKRRIAGVELRQACRLSPEEKEQLLCKLLARREEQNSSFEQVAYLYRQQTGEQPDLSVGVSEQERSEELIRLKAKARARRLSHRWAYARSNQIFSKPKEATRD